MIELSQEVGMRMFGIGVPELLLILLVCLLLFGAAKLPEIGRALGKTIKEFKNSLKETDADSEEQKKTS
jgi:sec-independent protein translocase protein TatA